MTVEKYSHEKHLPLVRQWLREYDFGEPDLALFSDCGFVVDNVAIAFLYTTNSAQGFIDQLISDPTSEKERRSRAIDQLFRELEAEARNRKVTQLRVLGNDTTSERFARLGYTKYDSFNFFYKDLQE